MDHSTPTTIVIFGASGDLAHRKLIPALFSLHRKGRLPANFKILGFAGRPWNDPTYRQEMSDAVEAFAGFSYTAEEWEAFASRLHYLSGDFNVSHSFDRLSGCLSELEDGPANRLFYLATRPELFAGIIAALGSWGMVAENGGWRRVVIEKPFGTDYGSARRLNASIHQVLDERQIYRIDHYLGKESVQNLMIFRFANILFEPVWNRSYIDHVQITVAEKVGVENRAGYYDRAGVVRDMFQNHLLQLLSLVAMDMEFHYRTSFGPMSIPEAYERLLLDALHGDPSLFTRGDRSELAWTLLDPILQAWEEQNAPPLHIYEPGSWGPEEADHMLAGEDRKWLRACGGHNIPA